MQQFLHFLKQGPPSATINVILCANEMFLLFYLAVGSDSSLPLQIFFLPVSSCHSSPGSPVLLWLGSIFPLCRSRADVHPGVLHLSPESIWLQATLPTLLRSEESEPRQPLTVDRDGETQGGSGGNRWKESHYFSPLHQWKPKQSRDGFRKRPRRTSKLWHDGGEDCSHARQAPLILCLRWG